MGASPTRSDRALARLVEDGDRLHLAHRSARCRKDATEAMKRALGDWWDCPADRLDRRNVVAIVDRLAPSVARALAACGRVCFRWGARRGSVPGNPFVFLPVALSNVQWDRVLTDAEAVRVWKAAAANTTPCGPIVRLLLLNRPAPGGSGRHDVGEVSTDLATWTIPAERTKNGVPSVAPPSALTQDLLRARLTIAAFPRQPHRV